MKGTMSPEELLETVSCYLGEGGDIKETETENLVNYLKQTSHEPVVQCTFMNIIRATTKHVVLSKFLLAGGWGVLHNWLVKYNDESNSSLLYELLQVYQVLPVDTALLRANDAAKLIKSLRRSPDEKIKLVAEDTINKWMQLVREHTKVASKGSNSSSKLGKKGKQLAEPAETPSKPEDGSKLAGSSSPNDTNDAIVENISNIAISATSTKETRERAKTVKLVNSRFRSTGLEEAVVRPASKKSSGAGAQNKPPATAAAAAATVAGIKRPVPSSQDGASNDKKIKNLTTSVDADIGRNRMLPPKPKSLFESTGFMDALTVPVAPTIKKKRKLSLTVQPGQAKQESTVPISPPLPGGTSFAVPTSPPAMAAPPSFYRDTLESPTAGPTTQSEDATAGADEQKYSAPTVSQATAGQQSPADESMGETASVASESSQSQTSGAGSGRKKKKQVSWAADNLLKEVFYFDLDETERVNVNRLKAEGQSTFDEMKKMEMRRDREVFMQGHAIGHSTGRESVIIKMDWFSPPPIDDLPPSRIVPGERSIEKLVQERRESKSLQALYFQKEKIPPSAEEVDPRANEIAEPSLRLTPVMIPLDQAEMLVGEMAEPMDTSASSLLGGVTLPDNLLALLAGVRGMQPPENTPVQPTVSMDQRALNAFVTPGSLQTSQAAPPFEQYYSDGGGTMSDHDVGLLGSGGLLGTGGLLGAGSLLGAGGLLGNGTLLGVGGPPGPMNGQQNQPGSHYRPARIEGGMNAPLLPSPPPVEFDPMVCPPQGPGGRGPRFHGLPPPPRMMHHNGMARGPGPGPMMRGPPPGGFRVQGGKPVVCRHFMKGSCKYGMNCQFFHPGVHN